jgi:predicted esterase
MRWQGPVLYAICILSTLMLEAQPPTHTGLFDPFIDDNINGFYEYLPRNYQNDVNTRYPLLIFLHGAGEMGNGRDMTILNRVLKNGPPKLISQGGFPDSFFVSGRWYKFIVLSPQIKNGINGNTATTAPSTIEALIQYAKNTYRIDTNKIYLSGLSMGGGTTWDYAGSSLSAANRLAGIIVACGAGDVDQQEAYNIATAKVPVLATHNTDDGTIAWGRTQNNINNILSYNPNMNPRPRPIFWSPPPAYGHNVWRRTFEVLQAGGVNGGDVTDTLGVDVYRWALQFARVTSALPVNWIDFTALKSANGVNLQWKVNAQENIRDYSVEKSIDGRRWNEIAKLQAKSGQGNLNYDYVDNSQQADKLYYRIKANDLNGQITYSLIRVVNGYSQFKVIIYPNPFVGNLRIQVPADVNQKIELRISDEQGRLVYNKEHFVKNSSIDISGLSGLKTGNYILQLISDSGESLWVQQLMKK